MLIIYIKALMSVSGVISHKPVIYKIWGIVPGCNWVISNYKGGEDGYPINIELS